MILEGKGGCERVRGGGKEWEMGWDLGILCLWGGPCLLYMMFHIISGSKYFAYFEERGRVREREERSDECHSCDRADYLIVIGVFARKWLV